MIEYDGKYLLEHFDNVCRFCLSQDNCLPILSEGTITESLAKVSEFILSKVDEDDGLPNNICQGCLECVARFVELEQRCQEAYEILHQITELRAANETEEQNYEDEVVKVEHVLEEVIASTEETLLDQLENDCSTTGEIFLNEEDEPESNLPEEEPESIQVEESTPMITHDQPTKKGKQCPICGKFVSQLSKHLPMHSDLKRHGCAVCGKQFAHDTTLRKHVRSVHLKIKNYQCEHCSESFADRSSLRYHDVVKHKDAKNFVCTICNKSYYTSTGLQQHNSLTHEQRKFKCDECGKMFAMKYHLKEHEKTHSDDRPFVCAFCDRTFKRAKNLNEHLSTHYKESK